MQVSDPLLVCALREAEIAKFYERGLSSVFVTENVHEKTDSWFDKAKIADPESASDFVKGIEYLRVPLFFS